MSEYARDAVWQTKGLTPMQRCILLAIAEECEMGIESKPVSQNALAGMCECTWLWILRETQKLEARGILEIMRPSAGSGHLECIYRIIHPNIRAEALKDLPEGLQETKPPKDPMDDPNWLKKKPSTSTVFGGNTRARRRERLACANGQSLVATIVLLKS